MTARARAHLLTRVAGRELLVVQDTTSLRDDGNKHGLYLHPAIVLDAADGALLGLLTADFLMHDDSPKPHCNQRRLEQKESRRWVEVTELAGDLLAAGARSVRMIADREADIYETFACRPEGVAVLVRAHHDRRLSDGGSLFEACQQETTALGQTTLDLPSASSRPARTAKVDLHACRISIRRPKRNRAELTAGLPRSVELTLVEARETAPPAGKTPLHWRLLTTDPMEDFAAAQRVVALYRRRWTIEQVFRVMKTQGFDIEAVPIRETMALKNLACATLIAAIQVQQMLHDRDGLAGRPMDDVFSAGQQPMIEAIGQTLEGRTQRQKNPHPPATLASLTWICARLGGWNGYYGKPGPIVLARGLTRLQTMIEGITRFGLVRIL